jgi:hypothetical protein
MEKFSGKPLSKPFAYATAMLCIAFGALASSPCALANAELDDYLNAPAPKPIVVTTKVKIALKQELDSLSCAEGDKIEATLVEDILHDDYVLAPKGSKVLGTVENVDLSRHIAKSLVAKKDRFRRHANMRLAFHEVVTPDNVHYEMEGQLSPQVAIFKTDGQCRRVRVDHRGELIRTETIELWQVPELELALPSSLFDKHRKEIKLLAGDRLAIDAKVETHTSSVSARVLRAGKNEVQK